MASTKPRIEIEYCTQCRWLLRAAWMAQELLVTFEQDVGGVLLVPGTGGVFDVRVDEVLVWSRATEGRFPDVKELKSLSGTELHLEKTWVTRTAEDRRFVKTSSKCDLHDDLSR